MAEFVAGGDGPSHAVLTRVFDRAGFELAAPHDPYSPMAQLTRAERVRAAVRAAMHEPEQARQLIDLLLVEYRKCGLFATGREGGAEADLRARVSAARAAFARIGWELTRQGELHPAPDDEDLQLEGRPLIEDQLQHLRLATEDRVNVLLRSNAEAALMLLTARNMLESTARYVLETLGAPDCTSLDFNELWERVRDQLGLNPFSVTICQIVGDDFQRILHVSSYIRHMAQTLGKLDPTKHKHALPQGISTEGADLMVREACDITDTVLTILDRRLGDQ